MIEAQVLGLSLASLLNLLSSSVHFHLLGVAVKMITSNTIYVCKTQSPEPTT